MDPLAVAFADESGYVAICDSVSLHYEIYKPPGGGSSSASSRKSPLLMVMGAFATKLHFSEMARYLADHSGHEVCIYDHRGVGKSSPPVLEAQTASQLAADAVAVADTLWGANTPFHVYGASMGGMVAQELALLLIPQHRLLSLSLAITCRGMMPAYGLLGPIFMPQVIKSFFEVYYRVSRPTLVRRLMRLLLTRQLMDAQHPCGQTYGQVYYNVWLEHFDDLWTFNNHAAGACHAHVVLHQYLSDKQIEIIRDCGVPIMCQVSSQDNLIPAAMQYELADKLRARTVTIPTGHMGMLPWKDRYYGALLDQLAMGEAIKGVKQAQRASSSKMLVPAGPGRPTAPFLALLSKPLLTAFSGASSSSFGPHIPTGVQAAAPSLASSAASASVSLSLGDLDSTSISDQQADDVIDLSIVLDDMPQEDNCKLTMHAHGVAGVKAV